MSMSKAMGQTAKTMGAMNKQVNLQDLQKTMQNFEQESAKMEMADELGGCGYQSSMHCNTIVYCCYSY